MKSDLITELVIKYNISDLKSILHDHGIFKTKSSILYEFLTNLQSDQVFLSSIDKYIETLLIGHIENLESKE